MSLWSCGLYWVRFTLPNDGWVPLKHWRICLISIDSGKWNFKERNLSPIHHKFHMNCSGIDAGSPLWQAGYWASPGQRLVYSCLLNSSSFNKWHVDMWSAVLEGCKMPCVWVVWSDVLMGCVKWSDNGVVKWHVYGSVKYLVNGVYAVTCLCGCEVSCLRGCEVACLRGRVKWRV